MNKAELVERTKAFLLLNCDRDEVTGCWNWRRAKTKNGYGTTGTKNTYVHRLAFELWKSDIPKGFLVCHHCDNPKCFNPDHLFIGTHKDNCWDAIKKGRFTPGRYPGAVPFKRGTDNGRAILNEQSVREIRASIATGRSLAKLYGVSPATIHLVKSRKSWKWLN